MIFRAIILLVLSACGGDISTSGDPDQSAGTAAKKNSMIYADGWGELTIRANLTETKVDALAHFRTERTACLKEEYGALSLSLWNAYAKSMNTAFKTPFGEKEQCFPVPSGVGKYMDGYANVKKPNGTVVTLFENTSGLGLCTKISDKRAAEVLIDSLHQIVRIADAEGCIYSEFFTEEDR